ncbi:MAG: hypothetical protein ACLU38_16045 [Dysosmobacter sp.]
MYLEKTCDYVNKSIYSYDYYRIVPAGVKADYTGIDAMVRHRQEQLQAAQQHQGYRDHRGYPALWRRRHQEPEEQLVLPHYHR